MNKYTLIEYLHFLNEKEIDEDIYIDGIELCMAVCGGDAKLTPCGFEHFKDALELPFNLEYGMVESDVDKDYDDYDNYGTGPIALAEELIKGLAGYCSSSTYEKYFGGKDAELI